jgi:hypothetical protein
MQRAIRVLLRHVQRWPAWMTPSEVAVLPQAPQMPNGLSILHVAAYIEVRFIGEELLPPSGHLRCLKCATPIRLLVLLLLL